MPAFHRILFPVDFSEHCRAVAPFVHSMAHRYGAAVTLIHVIQPPPPPYAGLDTFYPQAFDVAEVSEDLQRRIRSFADAELPRLDLTYVVEVGEPGAMVLECAGANHADLIAMPTHGYDIFRRILLGS